MKPSLVLSAIISLAAISFVPSTARASSFDEQELNQNHFAVVAAPYRHGYNLLILEQIPGQEKCWSEVGQSPTEIEPLFLNFDFTNACKRSSDSNNYSIRFDGKDRGLDYLTNIVEQDGELHLIGVPRDSNQPQLHLGKTNGLASGSLKIVLNPQWRLTKRLHGDNPTDHVYISNNSDRSQELISHAVQPVSGTQPNNQVRYATPPTQPVNPIDPNLGYQQSMPNNYQQPVYQQPAYQQPVYQQPILTPQQPPAVYPQQNTLPPASSQPPAVYPQPVYYSVPVNSVPSPQSPAVYPQPVYQQPPSN